jgi:hypothetical protein
MSAYDRPSFGFILSLLAIGLMLNALRTFTELLKAFMQVGVAETGLGWLILDVVALVWILACLSMLLARKRVFIYLFGGLLLFRLATAAIYLATGRSQLDAQVATAAMAVQVVIAALWFAYLFMSEHLRDVCSD